MPFNQLQFVQALETAGFRKDRSVYQSGAQFMVRKFGRQAVIVSVYGGHYCATLCLSSTNNGYQVKDQIMVSKDHNDLISKMAQWGLAAE